LSRDTRPRGADCCWGFPLFRAGAVGSRRRVLTAFSDAGAVGVSLHHTRREALAPGRQRVQRAGSIALGGLETYPCPHAVRRNGARHGAHAPVRCRRGGGAAHGNPARRSPPSTEPERVSHQRGRAQGGWPLRLGAVRAAGHVSFPSAMRRRTPGVSREASGAPAPLTTEREPCG
jgi:hypothetical protein